MDPKYVIEFRAGTQRCASCCRFLKDDKSGKRVCMLLPEPVFKNPYDWCSKWDISRKAWLKIQEFKRKVDEIAEMHGVDMIQDPPEDDE